MAHLPLSGELGPVKLGDLEIASTGDGQVDLVAVPDADDIWIWAESCEEAASYMSAASQ